MGTRTVKIETKVELDDVNSVSLEVKLQPSGNVGLVTTRAPGQDHVFILTPAEARGLRNGLSAIIREFTGP